METIKLNEVEIRAGLSRVLFAEVLIEQLPKDHDGRNTWLLNYGTLKEAKELRRVKELSFDEETQSCELRETDFGLKLNNFND